MGVCGERGRGMGSGVNLAWFISCIFIFFERFFVKVVMKYLKIFVFTLYFISFTAYGAEEFWKKSYCLDESTTQRAIQLTWAIADTMLSTLLERSDFQIETYFDEMESTAKLQGGAYYEFHRSYIENITSLYRDKKITGDQACRFVDSYVLYQVRGRENIFKKYKIDHLDIIIAHQYTTGLFDKMNLALRTKMISKPLSYLVRRLDVTLDRMPLYKGIVYRGTDLPESIVRNLKVGNEFSDLGFMSTSRLTGFSGAYKFIIISKTGRTIEDISASPDEYEVLFKRGTKFKITRLYSKEEYSKKQNYIEMEEISPK